MATRFSTFIGLLLGATACQISSKAPTPQPIATAESPQPQVVTSNLIKACSGDRQLGQNVAADKPVIGRYGGVTYGNRSDPRDFNTTTNASGGDWLNETNAGRGTYQIVDLARTHNLTGIGYRITWDGSFVNPLTVRVETSTDNKTWTAVSQQVHPYTPRDRHSGRNFINVDVKVCDVKARYVKYWLPPDGEWNGWGNFFQLRVFSLDN